MRKIAPYLFIISVAGIIFILSCKKEKSCEGCAENNKPPTAIAGPDQVITLPTDSVSLDGSASNDPDGTISEWRWTKISGPASFTLSTPETARTAVKDLSAGTYQFELRVRDNGGLTAKDTVGIIVDAVPTSNHAPSAHAGSDTTILLPINTVMLDGSRSNDPENNITGYSWSKIAGPSLFTITNTSAVQTPVISLVEGFYLFELKVTDAGGLYGLDTVQVNVGMTANHPPVANAGPDTTIILPAHIANLDGSRSSDPDNNISSYYWTKISGPSMFSISNSNVALTQVSNLVQGVYQFELKVTDADGLFSRDTIQITILGQPPSPAISCPPTNRPIIDLQLTLFGNIPSIAGGPAMVSADNKIFFAGGSSGSIPLSRVDIFNLTTQTWATTNLSLPRTNISAVACANKVFFAGGTSSSGPSSRVDIYDIATQSWSTAELSEARIRIVTATIGNKVFFAGGCSNTPFEWSGISNKVDIYDLSTNTWSVKILNETKIGFTATTVGSKIYFAGGWTPTASSSTSANIDIYDDASGTWSTSALNIAKGFHAGIFKNGKIYWSGGLTYIDEPWIGSNVITCQVEILDMNSQTTTFANLSKHFAYGNRVFEKGEKIGFLNYDHQSELYYVDIYNATTNTWSMGVLNPEWPAIGASWFISANNNIYLIAVGKIWKIDI